MNIEQIIKRALEEPTLVDALSVACGIECDRAVDRAINRPHSGSNGQLYDTCFKYTISRVTEAWNEIHCNTTN